MTSRPSIFGLRQARRIWDGLTDAQRRLLGNLTVYGGSLQKHGEGPTHWLYRADGIMSYYNPQTIGILSTLLLLRPSGSPPKFYLTDRGRLVVLAGALPTQNAAPQEIPHPTT